MPELAEARYFAQRWARAALSQSISSVHTHDRASIFRTADPAQLRRALTHAILARTETAAKKILCRFTSRGETSPTLWLGIHLGMSGELRAKTATYAITKHDHLVLRTTSHSLVFADPRMFGKIEFYSGLDAPTWWTDIAPALLSDAFTPTALATFFARRARSPLKAVLLMQEKFPGIGNWMADEILWRSALHPRQPAGTLTPAEIKILHHETRWVAREALRLIGESTAPTLPDPPAAWLYPHRWTDTGTCPKTKTKLARATIGGRTTCWSPALQKLRS